MSLLRCHQLPTHSHCHTSPTTLPSRSLFPAESGLPLSLDPWCCRRPLQGQSRWSRRADTTQTAGCPVVGALHALQHGLFVTFWGGRLRHFSSSPQAQSMSPTRPALLWHLPSDFHESLRQIRRASRIPRSPGALQLGNVSPCPWPGGEVITASPGRGANFFSLSQSCHPQAPNPHHHPSDFVLAAVDSRHPHIPRTRLIKSVPPVPFSWPDPFPFPIAFAHRCRHRLCRPSPSELVLTHSPRTRSSFS